MFSMKSFIPVLISILLCIVMNNAVYLLGVMACLVEVPFIIMAIEGCKKYKKHAGSVSYIKNVISCYEVAGTCFAIAAVAAVFSLIWFIFQMFSDFLGIFIDPNFWYVLLTVGNVYLFIKTGDYIQHMKREKTELEHPAISKSDEFFSEIVGQKEVSVDDDEIGRAAVSEKLLSKIPQDELVPDLQEVRELVQKSAAPLETPEKEKEKEIWICPICGTENDVTESDCSVCGTERDQGKERKNA